MFAVLGVFFAINALSLTTNQDVHICWGSLPLLLANSLKKSKTNSKFIKIGLFMQKLCIGFTPWKSSFYREIQSSFLKLRYKASIISALPSPPPPLSFQPGNVCVTIYCTSLTFRQGFVKLVAKNLIEQAMFSAVQFFAINVLGVYTNNCKLLGYIKDSSVMNN